MRIGLDLRPFLRNETGIGVYFRNLLFALAEIDRDNEYLLFSSSWKDRFAAEKIPDFACSRFYDAHLPVKVLNFLWNRLNRPALDFFFRTRLDLTHSPTPICLPTSGKKIITIHDLYFLDFPENTDRDTRKNMVKGFLRSLRRADGVILVSNYVRSQLQERFDLKDKLVQVIYHGADPHFRQIVPPDDLNRLRNKYALPSDFLLFVGAVEPRKNLPNLIRALKLLQQRNRNIPLVIVGRGGGDTTKLRTEINRLRLEKLVHVLDYLPFEDLRGIYRLASLLVFPSYCEGFGLPLLEAMASDLPVAASHTSSLPEIAREAAAYFDPLEPESIAECVERILSDDSVKQGLINKGQQRVLDFDWENSARATLQVYQQVGEQSV